MATSTGAEQNRYKYGGKELETSSGLNFHDFDARMLFNDHCLFGRPDPKAIDYSGMNPYVYCAGNPLRYVDPTGEILELAGNDDDLKDVVEIYQRAVGDAGTVTLDENKQVQFEINEGVDLKGNLAAKILNKIVNTQGVTKLNVENGSMVRIGDVNTGTIDIGDIKALGGETPINDIGALFHETYEQYEIQVYNKDINTAHIEACAKEGALSGVQMVQKRPIDVNPNTLESTMHCRYVIPLVGEKEVLIKFNSHKNIISR